MATFAGQIVQFIQTSSHMARIWRGIYKRKKEKDWEAFLKTKKWLSLQTSIIFSFKLSSKTVSFNWTVHLVHSCFTGIYKCGYRHTCYNHLQSPYNIWLFLITKQRFIIFNSLTGIRSNQETTLQREWNRSNIKHQKNGSSFVFSSLIFI